MAVSKGHIITFVAQIGSYCRAYVRSGADDEGD
jgi:hypothetical protein